MDLQAIGGLAHQRRKGRTVGSALLELEQGSRGHRRILRIGLSLREGPWERPVLDPPTT